MVTRHVKWCFNIRKWNPNRDEWLKLISSVALDEVERINKFVFQDDSKTALIGRALIRNFLSHALNRPSNEFILTRTEHGRPEVCDEYKRSSTSPWPKVLDFNVSHSGDYCVLAGLWNFDTNEDLSVGVDVTKIVRKNTKQELDRFLDLMSRREFSPSEWKIVQQVQDERQKCINFTRLWCLKESFIKSVGLGLKFGLNRLDFVFEEKFKYNITTEFLKDNILSSTSVLLDGQLADNWRFFETALDSEHLVALGYNLRSFRNNETNSWPDQLLDQSPFVELTIDKLLAGLTSISRPDEQNWTKFTTKLEKR